MANKILICDDQTMMRKMLKDLLVENGYEVIGEAEDGRDAVRKYKELRPDLVLMDIKMPKMNGFEALEAIKKENEEALVVMCSALGEKENVVESVRLGAEDFIVKPIDKEIVLRIIGKLL